LRIAERKKHARADEAAARTFAGNISHNRGIAAPISHLWKTAGFVPAVKRQKIAPERTPFSGMDTATQSSRGVSFDESCRAHPR
jgi:hypothetical protein